MPPPARLNPLTRNRTAAGNAPTSARNAHPGMADGPGGSRRVRGVLLAAANRARDTVVEGMANHGRAVVVAVGTANRGRAVVDTRSRGAQRAVAVPRGAEVARLGRGTVSGRRGTRFSSIHGGSR